MNPYMTQTEFEARLGERAHRIGRPDLLRKALRLDNPHMWGERADLTDDYRLPTPGEHAA